MINISSLTTMAATDYDPCPSSPYGYHEMIGRGYGEAYTGNTRVISGFASQCIHCNEVIVSEYNPHWSGTSLLGNYAVWYPGYMCTINISMTVTQIYYNSSLGSADFRGYQWI